VKGRDDFGTLLLYGPENATNPLIAAAHELKAPLILMRHLVQSLNAVSAPQGEQADYLERLQMTADRSLRFVQQLTLSYRLENDNQLPFAFALEPLSMNNICTEALHELTPYARQHKQQLELTGLHCPHLVLANRDVLHDIVVNLVDNAIQHNPSGKVIHVMAECRGPQVRLAVRDSGTSVTPSELKTLRQNMGQQPQPLNGRSGTSGLGLYIVQQFAQAMGGSLGMGRTNSGMTFFVDLLRSRQLSLL